MYAIKKSLKSAIQHFEIINSNCIAVEGQNNTHVVIYTE